MAHDRALVLTLLAVVLAGCASVPTAPAGGDEWLSDDPHPGTPVVTQETTETPVPTAEPRPNLWNDSTLTVAVDAEAAGDRDVVGFVAAAAAFWTDHSDPFAGYEISLAVDADAENPDVVVEFVDNVANCDGVAHAAGCAPVVDDPGDIDRPETVTVRTGLSDASTEHVLRHEFGHLLGVEHGDPPKAVMRADATIETVPRPNATERTFPWPDRTFAVFLDFDDDADTERRQTRNALDYYDRGAPGMPANLTFVVTENRSAAEIVIREGDCSGTAKSCFTTRGPDPDGDGAIEAYHRAEIVVDDVPADAVGWHAGNWLAYLLGAEAAAERPPPFRDASAENRRSEWWTDE